MEVRFTVWTSSSCEHSDANSRNTGLHEPSVADFRASRTLGHAFSLLVKIGSLTTFDHHPVFNANWIWRDDVEVVVIRPAVVTGAPLAPNKVLLATGGEKFA